MNKIKASKKLSTSLSRSSSSSLNHSQNSKKRLSLLSLHKNNF